MDYVNHVQGVIGFSLALNYPCFLVLGLSLRRQRMRRYTNPHINATIYFIFFG
jgi:hypothetical protein